ncbi:hypothetical protein [Vibrio parahaemolyticus]|uniref:hypothetical protein n=1 Tax=Vibrio parahaemolyticus TaxID=670 RepID=UPI00094207FD|nr:hypothetical protein [Vibrio parahaemolyticus]OKY34020.1 hypothetical protein BUE73_21920 [Vibrio parahaemolyticus]OKY34857.1 hypothetical protein BUE11_21090 [Vibrio parahaemolyticus]RFD34779.1 hypothetical protein BKD11_05150 [Vibrio parahaemolyticus]HCE1714492.1 hypothetical protein [Vibrio parahaemolyticus]HCE2666406.1 hypothetical protein [Vibrio parahaemolyticus]
MLDTQEQIEQFRQFLDVGGLKEAENLTRGKSLKVKCESLSEKLSGCVSEDIEDYQGASKLVATLKGLNGSVSATVATLTQWNEHLVLITDPTDLEQVSIGVNIKRKVDGTEDNVPAPSILPITSKEELKALEAVINGLSGHVDEAVSLMTQINGALTPPTGGSGTGGGATLPPPVLPPELANKADALNEVMTPLAGGVASSSKVIEAMIIASKEERTLALDYFTKAISFTICSNQTKKPSIKDATAEVFTL